MVRYLNLSETVGAIRRGVMSCAFTIPRFFKLV